MSWPPGPFPDAEPNPEFERMREARRWRGPRDMSRNIFGAIDFDAPQRGSPSPGVLRAELDTFNAERLHLQQSVEALPAESRTAPGIPEVLAQMRLLFGKVDAFQRATEIAEKQDRQTGRRQFWWGIGMGALLSVPLGVLAAWIAVKLGIG